MKYEREILAILTEAGNNGLSVGKIARHVFNANNSIFEPITFDEVREVVGRYLRLQACRKDGVVEKGEKRGVYRINMHSNDTRQLLLRFFPFEDETEKGEPSVDQSLSLF